MNEKQIDQYMDHEKQIEALLRAARHYRRTVLRYRRIVYGSHPGLSPEVERVTKQLQQAEGNLKQRAECYGHRVLDGKAKS